MVLLNGPVTTVQHWLSLPSCLVVSVGVEWGAEHAQTRERGPPSALEEIFRYFFPLVVVLLLTTAIQNRRRGCCRVPKFCMGS